MGPPASNGSLAESGKLTAESFDVRNLQAAIAQAARRSRSGGVLWSLLYLASIGTVGSFVGQTWSQRHMSATHTAIIFALEPVFAAILAGWFLQECLGPRGFAGGALVLIGIVVSELRLRRTKSESASGGAPE